MTDQDGLRDEIVAVLLQHTRTRIEDCRCGWGVDAGNIGQSHTHHTADAVLDKVQARIDAAREQVAEQIAQAIEALPHGKTHNTPWLPDFDAGWRHCRMDVLDVIRQHAKGGGTP